MAGANISGDLADASRAIPYGTMAASGFTFVVYVLLFTMTAASCTSALLLNDYSYMQVSAITINQPCSAQLNLPKEGWPSFQTMFAVVVFWCFFPPWGSTFPGHQPGSADRNCRHIFRNALGFSEHADRRVQNPTGHLAGQPAWGLVWLFLEGGKQPDPGSHPKLVSGAGACRPPVRLPAHAMASDTRQVKLPPVSQPWPTTTASWIRTLPMPCAQ